MFFNQLPLEIQSKIFSYVDAKTLRQISQVSSTLHYLADDNQQWLAQLMQTYDIQQFNLSEQTNYKQVYKTYYEARIQSVLNSIENRMTTQNYINLLNEYPKLKFELIKRIANILITNRNNFLDITNNLRWRDYEAGLALINEVISYNKYLARIIKTRDDFETVVKSLRNQFNHNLADTLITKIMTDENHEYKFYLIQNCQDFYSIYNNLVYWKHYTLADMLVKHVTDTNRGYLNHVISNIDDFINFVPWLRRQNRYQELAHSIIKYVMGNSHCYLRLFKNDIDRSLAATYLKDWGYPELAEKVKPFSAYFSPYQLRP